MRLARTCKKNRLLVLTLFLSIASYIGHSYAEVYKSVDERGKVTFSDKPDPAADKVELREPNTVKSLDIPAKPKPAAGIEAAVGDYTLVSISNPQNDAIIANGLVPFTVSAKVAPALQKGHQLQLSIDGSIHSTSQGSFSVTRIARGEHHLQVAVVDGDGKVLKTSRPVKIFAYRPS